MNASGDGLGEGQSKEHFRQSWYSALEWRQALEIFVKELEGRNTEKRVEPDDLGHEIGSFNRNHTDRIHLFLMGVHPHIHRAMTVQVAEELKDEALFTYNISLPVRYVGQGQSLLLYATFRLDPEHLP